MKRFLILILSVLTFTGVKSQLRTTLLSGASPNGSWTLLGSPPLDSVSSLLIGDNPIIDWTLQPSGEYILRYRVCSGFCSTCCRSTISKFYNLDLGYISEKDTSICCYTNTASLLSLIDSFYLGLNAAYTFKVLPDTVVYTLGLESCLEFICDSVGTFELEITETPLQPFGYILDSVSAPIKTFSFNIEVLDDCCQDTILTTCSSYIANKDSTIVLKPPIAGAWDWTKDGIMFATSDSLIISEVSISDLGRYCVYIQSECVEAYCIDVAFIIALNNKVGYVKFDLYLSLIVILSLILIIVCIKKLE